MIWTNSSRSNPFEEDLKNLARLLDIFAKTLNPPKKGKKGGQGKNSKEEAKEGTKEVAGEATDSHQEEVEQDASPAAVRGLSCIFLSMQDTPVEFQFKVLLLCEQNSISVQWLSHVPFIYPQVPTKISEVSTAIELLEKKRV